MKEGRLENAADYIPEDADNGNRRKVAAFGSPS
jgi:hypothetical protein